VPHHHSRPHPDLLALPTAPQARPRPRPSRPGAARAAADRAAPVLTALATWQTPLNHQTLDNAGAEHGGRSHAIEHLRQLLVASAALPDRDEHLHRLEQRLAHAITAAHPDDQPVLRAYATWHLLRRLRSRADQGAPTLHAANRARDVLAEAARLLHALREDDRDLARCSQAELDAWVTSPSTARRLLPSFLAWAAQQRHMPAELHVLAAPAWQLGAADPVDQRWTQTRRLLNDDTLPASDRVAGLLVLLYGQTLTRISRLRRHDVHVVGSDPAGQRVQLRLGRDAINLPEPLAALIHELPVAVASGTAQRLPDSGDWLFPGRRPGRAAHPATLATRLRRLGVKPRAARNSALLHLAEHLPSAVLADLLGLHLTTAEKWSITAGSRWMTYAGDR